VAQAVERQTCFQEIEGFTVQ